MARPVPAACPDCSATLHVDPAVPMADCRSCGAALYVQRKPLFGSPPPPPPAYEQMSALPVRSAGTIAVIVFAICLGLPALCLIPLSLGLFLTTPKESDKQPPALTDEQSCVRQGDGRRCYLAAYAYQFGQARAKDQPRAIELYDKSCDLSYAQGCANLGWIYDEGVDVERQPDKAITYHKRACALGNAGGCNNLGWAFQRGAGVDENIESAVEMYEKACSLGSALGCINVVHTAPHNPALRDHPEKTNEYLGIACNLGHAKGCMWLAHRYSTGTGAAKDLDRAAALHKKACSLGAEAACK